MTRHLVTTFVIPALGGYVERVLSVLLPSSVYNSLTARWLLNFTIEVLFPIFLVFQALTHFVPPLLRAIKTFLALVRADYSLWLAESVVLGSLQVAAAVARYIMGLSSLINSIITAILSPFVRVYNGIVGATSALTPIVANIYAWFASLVDAMLDAVYVLAGARLARLVRTLQMFFRPIEAIVRLAFRGTIMLGNIAFGIIRSCAAMASNVKLPPFVGEIWRRASGIGARSFVAAKGLFRRPWR